MATKRQITLRFRDEYMKASKKDKGRILDEMCSVLAIGRSTARRRLAEAGRGRPSPPPEERLKRYSEQSRDLLVRVWLMMDLPCAKYLKAMLPTWLPMLRAHGELADYDGFAFLELERMSSATMDRYLEKTRDAARPRGTVPTRPAGELLRNSIAIRKAGDELDGLPGNVEADTVAHCGPSARGEFCRTLTVVDIATGWTERLLSQQRVRELLQGRGDDRGADAVPHPPLRHGQRQRIHQPGPDRMATGARHRADPLPPLQEERPGHRRIQEQPHRAPSRVPLPVHGRRARPSQRAMGVGAHQGQPVHPVQEARRPGLHPRRAAAARLRRAAHPVGEAQGVRREGPGRGRTGIHPARQTRGDRTDHRHDEPRGARPAHPRHTGPTRSPGRATHCTARQTRRPGHGILEQDARPDRGRRTGRRRNPAGRRGLGFRAHPR